MYDFKYSVVIIQNLGLCEEDAELLKIPTEILRHEVALFKTSEMAFLFKEALEDFINKKDFGGEHVPNYFSPVVRVYEQSILCEPVRE